MPEGIIPVLIITLVISCCVFFYLRYKIRQGYDTVMQQIKSGKIDDLLDYQHKILSKGPIPEHRFVLAYSNSLAYSIYGDFTRAIMVLEAHDDEMNNKKPIYQACYLNALVVNNYLCLRNIEDTIGLAEQCKTLGKGSPLSVTTRSNDIGHQTYVLMGMLLLDHENTNAREQLEKLYLKTQGISKLMSAWVLGRTYKRLGQLEDFHTMVSYLREAAPGCAPLHNF